MVHVRKKIHFKVSFTIVWYAACIRKVQTRTSTIKAVAVARVSGLNEVNEVRNTAGFNSGSKNNNDQADQNIEILDCYGKEIFPVMYR